MFQVPGQVGRVGQHAQRVVVETQFPAVDNLQHHLASRLVDKAPVYGRGTRVDLYHMNLAHGVFHFVNRGTFAQQPCQQLQVGDGRRLFLRCISLVLAIRRKVEQSGRQSGFVQPFGHELFLFHGQPDVTIAGRKVHAVRLSAGQQRLFTTTYWLFRSLPPHSMVRATTVCPSLLFRVMPVHASAGRAVAPDRAAASSVMDNVFLINKMNKGVDESAIYYLLTAGGLILFISPFNTPALGFLGVR